MAISKSSSLNSQALRQTPQLGNELLDAIKTASNQGVHGNLDAFQNFLKDQSLSNAVLIKDTQQVQGIDKSQNKKARDSAGSVHLVKQERPAPKAGTKTDIPDRSKEPDFPKDQSFVEDNSADPKQISLAEQETVKEGMGQQNPQTVPVFFSGITGLDEPLTLGINPSIGASDNQDIKEWVAQGRVIIENNSTSQMQEDLSGIDLLNLTQAIAQDALYDGQAQKLEVDPHALAVQADPSLKKISDPGAELQNLPTQEFKRSDYELGTGDSGKSYPQSQSEMTQSGSQSQDPLSPQPIPVAMMTQAQDAKAEVKALNLKEASTVSGVHSQLATSAAAHSSSQIIKPVALTTADKLSALNQIKDQLRQGLKQGDTKLSIQLKPYELGKVDIKLDISRDGIVSAMFKAENRETLEVLSRHSQDIQSLFKEAGLQANSQGMSFSMSQNHQDSFGSATKMQRARFDADEAELSAIVRTPPLSIVSSTRVDISV